MKMVITALVIIVVSIFLANIDNDDSDHLAM